MKIKFENIRAEIVRKGWTIEQFCNVIGISKKTFYLWEKKGDFPLSNALKMSAIFEKPIDYIIGIEDMSA